MSENETAKAVAVLLEENSLVEDESQGSRVHNKGYFGTPRSGGGLELAPDIAAMGYRLDYLTGKNGGGGYGRK